MPSSPSVRRRRSRCGVSPGHDEEARHLHLADADLLCDLTLGELAIEPKGDDHSFLLGQPVEQFGHNEAGVDDIPWLVAGWIAIEFVGSVGVGCVERRAI